VYLAKGSSITKDDYHRESDSSGIGSWWEAYVKECTYRDDGCAVTFKIANKSPHYRLPEWEVVTGGKPLPKPPRTIVNKKAKASLKDHIVKFREWGMTMYPMLPKDTYEYEQRMRNETKEYVAERMGNPHYYAWSLLSIFLDHPTLTREIVKDEQHPLRLHLAYGILSDYMEHTLRMGEEQGLDDKEIQARIMSAFNHKINRTCGFLSTVKG
tara:strand:- start:2815 stop:3450 length:636 start_codon:yes stop_codon:yes gene_type:complete